MILFHAFLIDMNLKESTLAALTEMKCWADAAQVFDFMKNHNYFIGNSKTPYKSVISVLYRFAEEKTIDRKNEENHKLPLYKAKSLD